MMQINNVFNQAELALAAYANLTSGVAPTKTNLIENASFSEKQADEFIKRYPTVITQHTDPDTSFTATVFKDSSGQLTLALRGTLEARDYVTDGDIWLAGTGYDQIVSMYNWWQRASTPAGQQGAQYQLTSYLNNVDPKPPADAVLLYKAGLATVYLESAVSVVATGELVTAIATDIGHKLDVTGHSLGGHLAMAFGSLFPVASGQITVFDAPGFMSTDTNQQFFARLGGSIPNGANTANVIASEANVGSVPWNAIAGLHSRPGEAINIAIENQVPGGEPDKPLARNHSQMVLTDALAVYNLLAKLDPGLSIARFHTILTVSDNFAYQSLERVIDAIETTLLGDSALLPTGHLQRDAFYNAIYKLQENPLFQTLQGRVQIVAASPDGTAAKTDFGALLSLLNLTPIALKPNDSVASTLLESTQSVLAAKWYEDKALSAEDRAEGKAHFSDEYLADRAAMLSWIMKRNYEDNTSGVMTGPNAFFHDINTNTDIRLGAVSDANSRLIGILIGC